MKGLILKSFHQLLQSICPFHIKMNVQQRTLIWFPVILTSNMELSSKYHKSLCRKIVRVGKNFGGCTFSVGINQMSWSSLTNMRKYTKFHEITLWHKTDFMVTSRKTGLVEVTLRIKEVLFLFSAETKKFLGFSCCFNFLAQQKMMINLGNKQLLKTNLLGFQVPSSCFITFCCKICCHGKFKVLSQRRTWKFDRPSCGTLKFPEKYYGLRNIRRWRLLKALSKWCRRQNLKTTKNFTGIVPRSAVYSSFFMASLFLAGITPITFSLMSDTWEFIWPMTSSTAAWLFL